MKNLIGFLLLIIFLIVPISGQNSSQTKVSGLIKDQNDAVVVGARVFLLNVQTRMEKVTVTDSGGTFTFDKVAPGNYEIRIAAEGFAQQITPVQITTAGI
ncbi:MAG: carboxypeptidase regulatory-like domain-containing protein, partial [Acidobacteria bacterium]|nr:carboxypeptidase regulatory-like domain-containing protein [Acidobacteriota bacterium]